MPTTKCPSCLDFLYKIFDPIKSNCKAAQGPQIGHGWAICWVDFISDHAHEQSLFICWCSSWFNDQGICHTAHRSVSVFLVNVDIRSKPPCYMGSHSKRCQCRNPRAWCMRCPMLPWQRLPECWNSMYSKYEILRGIAYSIWYDLALLVSFESHSPWIIAMWRIDWLLGTMCNPFRS